MSLTDTALQNRLKVDLSNGLKLDFYHISTPPTRCSALYAPPPGCKPVKTYCESHFLNVIHSNLVDSKKRKLALFAIEIYIYTSETLTTIFVSKADSTGFADSVGIPRTSPSILRTITSSFTSLLVDARHRPDRKLTLSLFARAQDQYLFPGSIEHGQKHVLSDRGLIKWWCRALDPVLRTYPDVDDAQVPDREGQRVLAEAYVVVPGYDKHETSALFPESIRRDSVDAKRWINGHPLRELTSYPTAAPRSIIPHFPDDPKSRFLLDLDDELTTSSSSQANTAKSPSPSKHGSGQWKSVKTLDQFWEMMAYRQECSSGRLVGFIWLVFSPSDETALIGEGEAPDSPSLRPVKRKLASAEQQSQEEKKATNPRKRRKLQGMIVARPPRVKGAASSAGLRKTLPETTRRWFWPASTRGTIVLDEKAYTRVTEVLLRLDFPSLDVAYASTEKWIHEAAVIAGTNADWGVSVEGTAVSDSSYKPANNGAITSENGSMQRPAGDDTTDTRAASTTLNGSLVRRKPKLEQSEQQDAKTLDNGIVRKKTKPAASPPTGSPAGEAPQLNILSSASIRKKPK